MKWHHEDFARSQARRSGNTRAEKLWNPLQRWSRWAEIWLKAARRRKLPYVHWDHGCGDTMNRLLPSRPHMFIFFPFHFLGPVNTIVYIEDAGVALVNYLTLQL